jgi:hypothetical protein
MIPLEREAEWMKPLKEVINATMTQSVGQPLRASNAIEG